MHLIFLVVFIVFVVIIVIIIVVVSIFVMAIIVVVIIISIFWLVISTGRITTKPYPRVETDTAIFSYEGVSIVAAVSSMITRVITRNVNLSPNWRFEFRALDFCKKRTFEYLWFLLDNSDIKCDLIAYFCVTMV